MIKKLNTVNQTEFATMQNWSKSYVTELKKAGRLVFDLSGKIDVEATLIRIRDTQDPNRADVKERHAAQRVKPSALTTDQICHELLSVRNPSQEARSAAVALIRKGETAALNKSRADKEHWLGLQAKLDYETALGIVVNKKDMMDAVSDLVTSFRQELENMPHLVASELVGKDVDIIRSQLKVEARNILANLERGCREKIQSGKVE